jgi:putative nucleotidyltransferase with HDIG domain
MSQAFVPCVSAAGLLVVGHCISTMLQQPIPRDWWALAALTLLTGSFTIKIPSIPVRLSVSETFVFASVLLFGTCAGTIIVAVEILVVIFAGTGGRARDPLRILFNVSAATLSIWIASHAFYAAADIPPLNKHEAALDTLILPLALMSTIYFVMNSGMVAAAVAIQNHQPILKTWRSNFLGLAVNYVGGASLAALFVSYTRTIDLFALGIIIPLLVISYLTFKTSFSRVEDATRHVEEVKRLYLSTIETLATAIDAKDQVTHGHIRRVQQVALALARELGVKDESQLQALEAAALLHDTGKLVVPEHILNKPGKLTRAEFEKMKQHAPVGAEILSSIKFPYPVVPIVRHHHENWDGTGYPDGLRGTEIPLGARILAVVDCYDALTSDRPYRPRMSDSDALSILLQRRAVMYDPLVVDAFTNNWQRLIAVDEASIAAEPRFTPRQAVKASLAPQTPVLEDVSSHLLEPIAKMLDGALDATGARLAIVYGIDSDRDRLVSLSIRNRDGAYKRTITLPMGSGVSGWVAVNGAPISNADPSLDFPDDPLGERLVRCICVPLTLNGHVRGVLSLYSDDPRGFSDDDKSYVQQLAAEFDRERPSQVFSDLLRAKNSVPEITRTVH